ncbi:MAG: hypothetical protein ACK5MN_02690 [Lachnospiraceae bacterium]
MPDWVEYQSEAEAHKVNEEIMVFALLTANAIFLFYGKDVQKILPEQQDMYQFSILNEEAYSRMGPPLSPEDIDRLIDRNELETVIFSEHYMFTEDDYMRFDGNLADVYKALENRAEPHHHMPETEAYPSSTGTPGYLFESIWYAVERMES